MTGSVDNKRIEYLIHHLTDLWFQLMNVDLIKLNPNIYGNAVETIGSQEFRCRRKKVVKQVPGSGNEISDFTETFYRCRRLPFLLDKYPFAMDAFHVAIVLEQAQGIIYRYITGIQLSGKLPASWELIPRAVDPVPDLSRQGIAQLPVFRRA